MNAPPLRPKIEHPLAALPPRAAERSLPWPARLWAQGWLRRGVILALLALLWEFVARLQNNDMLLPTFGQPLHALVDGVLSGELLIKARISLALLLQGYACGVAAAFVLTTLAVSSQFGLHFVLQILVPAALPAILSGPQIAWAFAWRTLIAAELVFGASSGKGGLGWYIFQARNELFTDKVFAGLAMVILIGLAVEGLVFQTLERLTVRRWGMQR